MKTIGIDIEVFDEFRMVADEFNVIVYRKTIVDPTKSPNWSKRKAEGKSPEKRVEWLNPTYHSTVEDALQKIAETRIRECDARTLKELVREIREIRREISDVLAVRV